MMHTKSLIKQVQASVEDSLSTQAQYRLRRQDSQHMLKHLHHQHVIRVRALQLCPSLGGVRFGNADHGDLNALIGTRQKQLTLEQAAALAGAHKTSKHQKQDGGGTSHHKYHDKAAAMAKHTDKGMGSLMKVSSNCVHRSCTTHAGPRCPPQAEVPELQASDGVGPSGHQAAVLMSTLDVCSQHFVQSTQD
eukprot:CAMPEP_0203899862 /NCGR_PEP_ID=MMETSP0359-20131031/42219_1 /ASSEMBLY_ACC=CAM_ASM_000338 /TAXON_ID=268821 /ORGANISM="Scrippsiella Hangoei, Strain SHTV-5" /LENGTH=190 /DNA_ID=CAMNT_0050823201 /DNA_START=163 /DNA_END=733 /DNA_ORIENTATION=+